MPIEFRCHQCQKLLRTKDDTAGKQAKCPQCGTVLTVPQASAPPPSAPEYTAPPAIDTGNPFQAPATRKTRAAATAASSTGELTHTKLDMSELMSRTWSIYKSKLGFCLAVTLVMILAIFLVVGVMMGLLIATGLNESAPVVVLATLVYLAAIIWLSVGQCIVYLKVARGQQASIGDLFSGGSRMLPAALVLLVQMIVVDIGIILCIVPGIILGVMFSQAMLFSIDRGVGLSDAFMLSKQYTQGNKMTLFLAFFIVSLINSATCGLGGIFILPYMMLMIAVAYLTMTGQPTVDQG